MKKLIIILMLIMMNFTAATVKAQDNAYIRGINITETSDSVELNLDSASNVPYNVVNYANGDVGIKLNHASVDSNFNNSNPVTISKKQDINSAQLYQSGQNDLEIKLNGNNNLANKKVTVTNTPRNSNIILIETPPEEEISYKPLSVGNTIRELPDIRNISFSPPPLTSAIDKNNKNRAEVKYPISMYTERADNNHNPGKRLIAQATPDDTKNILNLDNTKNNANPLNAPASVPVNAPINTAPAIDPAAGNVKTPAGTNATSFSIPPKSATTTSSTSTTEPADKKSNGLMETIWDFINKNFIIVVSVLAGGVFLLIVLGIIIFFASRGKPHDDYGNYPEDMMGSQPDQQAGTVDNDPVNYIPPGPMDSPKSVEEAISKIVFMKNRPGQ